MADIDINFSGLIALAIFLIAAAASALVGIISLIVAIAKTSNSGQKPGDHRAFAYLISALPLLIANVILFVIVFSFFKTNMRSTNDLIDKVTIFAWLPLQPIIWILCRMIINKRKK